MNGKNHFQKKPEKTFKIENQSQNAACEEKPQARKKIWFKQKTRPRMNYERIEKTIQKKEPIQETENNKNQSEIAASEQKTDFFEHRKANFCLNTVFSLYLEQRFLL